MTSQFMRRSIELGRMILLLTGVVFSSQLDQKFAQSQRQNALALRQFTWKSQTEIQKGGASKSVQVAQMQYDRNGTLQKTTISSTPQQSIPTHGIRGLIAQKKKEDFLETLDQLNSLANSYRELPPNSMEKFMATAVVTPEIGRQQKQFRIQGREVLYPGDSMTVWIDAETRKLRRIEIQTTMERKPVRIVSEYQDLPQGPTYLAHSVIAYPSDDLRIILNTFDYEPLTR